MNQKYFRLGTRFQIEGCNKEKKPILMRIVTIKKEISEQDHLIVQVQKNI